jgi:cation-transporting ATPase E
LTLNSPSHSGLTSAQVQERIVRGETNTFKARVGRSYWQIFRDNVLNVFNIVLFTLLITVLFFREYGTVFFAGFSVVWNSLLGMAQEMSAKRKLDQMAALAARDVKVWRDGQIKSIHSSQIVKDDVLVIEPGDRLVVDGRVLHSDALEMDESHLTGESDAVLKNEGDEVHSGAFCIAGAGAMVATRVGKDSTINKLSVIAKAYKQQLTPTQEKIAAIVQVSVLVMAIMVPMIFLAGFLNDVPFADILNNAVVFVTSIVPQGLVLVAILSLTLGALSISRHQTLIQRVNAVESMANVTVLCLDKTGTITRNELSVSEIIPLNGASSEDIQAALRRYITNLAHQNRTAATIAQYLGANNSPDVVKSKEIPFTSARKWGAIVLPNDETLLMGAPERLLPSHSDGVPESASKGIMVLANEYSTQGKRVLAFARASHVPDTSQLHVQCEPIALVVMSDRVREDIKDTLQAFRDQGVQVKVISGDNLETVRSIAHEAGISVDLAYTGDQLDTMTPDELQLAATHADVFARISPDTKKHLIAALKAQGHYVGMVGDGVNDVPALKEANLAIVMNDGAQISKDVGDIVLLNNAVSTLPLAFKEGKAITQTIFGTTKMFLIKNLYGLLFFTFVGFMTLPFPITPIQISWVTFGTVNIPATLIAFQLLRPTHMQRFRRDVLDHVVTMGVIGGVSMAVLYALVFITNQQNVMMARSSITVYVALFGVLVFWMIHGFDPVQPSTLKGNRGLVFAGLGFLTLTFIPAYIFVDTFKFVPPNTPAIILILTIFMLTAILSSLGIRYRNLLNQLWELFSPK